MIEQIQSLFPFKTPRKNQLEIISKIIEAFESGKRFVILEAPTGTGKSAIGYTLCKYSNSAFTITSNKFLQSQLTNDFGENGKFATLGAEMIELKGRNAYPCNYYERALKDENFKFFSDEQIARYKKLTEDNIDCSKGECKRKGKSKLKYCLGYCPYYNQFQKAIAAPYTLMNFHSFIFQTEFVDGWNKRELLIIDEAHTTEQVLMDYVSISFNELNIDHEIPKFEESEEYLLYFEEINLSDLITEKIKIAHESGNQEDEEFWEKQALKYMLFKESISNNTCSWISKWEKIEIGPKEIAKVEIKPLFIDKFSEPLLFSKADRILMMSATILSVKIICEALGIDRSEVAAIKLDSTFPVRNRPIYYKPVGSMAYKDKQKTLPKMLKSVEEISNTYDDKRGIIHTHSFDIADYIVQNATNKLKERLFYQKDYNTKEDMLEKFLEKENAIIIAPAMHEGVDLKDDQARFSIICKVPFAGLGDNPQIKKRMELSNDYYNYLAVLKLTQAYGRIIRSEEDWGHTFILDECFKSFFNRSKDLFPTWFKEAVKWK